jgi:putative endonuclease
VKPPIAPAPWFVYMLECRGGRIYTGVTPDLAARLARHRAGKGGAFTRSFPPRRMLAAMRCAGRGEALSTEHALKQLGRPEKLAWARRNKVDARLRGHGEFKAAARGTRRPPPRAGARSRSS